MATEDRGEGIFIQLDETAVATWEKRVLDTDLWTSHRDAHRRNFERRFSDTAGQVDPDTRLKPPRYWLVHTFAHILIRELALTCGYSAASLSERLYAWPAAEGRDPQPAFSSAPPPPTATAPSAASYSSASPRASSESSTARCAKPHAAPRIPSAPSALHRTPRISYTVPPAIAA